LRPVVIDSRLHPLNAGIDLKKLEVIHAFSFENHPHLRNANDLPALRSAAICPRQGTIRVKLGQRHQRQYLGSLKTRDRL
jgi:hypothetical protein